jgi:C-terminal processing protease CtpA/Prc
MSNLRIILVGFLYLCSSMLHAADEFDYLLLKDRRDVVKLPAYTLEVKKLILRQARLTLLDFYVNRDLKIASFGRGVDPLQRLKRLEAQLESVSIEQFHQEIIDTFDLQRDFHTRYSLPLPYGCYRNMMPFSLAEIHDSGRQKVVISELNQDPRLLTLLPKDLNLEIGDELLSVDGQTLKALFNRRAPYMVGANQDAAKRYFLEQLSFTVQKFHLMPKGDEVMLRLRKKNGRISQVRIPWVNRGRASCLESNPLSIAVGRKRNEAKDLSPLPEAMNPTEESDISWKIIKNKHGRFAVLRMDDFEPDQLSEEDITLMLEKLILDEFANTDGLIIDLRNNLGGQIILGEMMLPLFVPQKEIRRLRFSFKINDANLFFLTDALDDSRLIKSFNEALQRGDKLSPPLFVTETVPDLIKRPAYTKPIALFTSAECYSTCDMFASLMQDHGSAIIVGEDRSTGGGGASVVSHQNVTQALEGYDMGQFEPLPANQDMRFAWRQTYRISGRLIENVGIKSNYVIKPTLDDISHESRKQLLEISRLLDAQ